MELGSSDLVVDVAGVHDTCAVLAVENKLGDLLTSVKCEAVKLVDDQFLTS